MLSLKGWSLTRTGKLVFVYVVLLIIIPVVVYGVSLNEKKKHEALPMLDRITSGKAQSEALSLVEEVGKLVDLPSGEIPAVATVTEIEKLRAQEFYSKAQNGDKVLIYQDAHMAYIYRPTSKKLIAVAPVEFESELQQKKNEEAQRGVASASDSAEESPESLPITPSPTAKPIRSLNLQ